MRHKNAKMKLLSLPVLLAGALFASGVAADTCDTIKKSDADFSVKGLLWPRWYWSTACKALKPSCVLLPETTEDVVNIVNLLLDSDEPFAVKSGGHNPNKYFGSVEGGPLVSMERLNEVTLDEEAQTVRVGPGNRWQDVQSALDGTGYTVVGGRIGHVGVSGLLLGGTLPSPHRPNLVIILTPTQVASASSAPSTGGQPTPSSSTTSSSPTGPP